MHRSTPSPTPGIRGPRIRPGRWIASASALAIAAATLFAIPSAALATTTTPPDQWTGLYGNAGSASDNPGEHVLTASTASKLKTAWSSQYRNHGAYPPVVLGGVVYSVAEVPSTSAAVFTAASPRTGAVLWTLQLPYSANAYGYGMTGTGSTIFISYRVNPAGGVLAVNTTKRTVAWRATLPASTSSDFDRTYPGIPTTDGTNVYISGSSNSVNAYSVATGSLRWIVPVAYNSNGTIAGVTGVAAGGGVVYTAGQQGLIARSPTTGKQIWQGPTGYSLSSPPVLAGGRVFLSEPRYVAAFRASGCGAATCAPTWTAPVDNWDLGPTITSDGTSVFLSYRTENPGGPTACTSGFIGNIARLSASTGKQQWHITVGNGVEGLIEAGSMIWAFNDELVSCVGGERIIGFSTTATGSTPLFSKQLSTDVAGYPAALVAASGTLFQTAMQRILIGYRVPGT